MPDQEPLVALYDGGPVPGVPGETISTTIRNAFFYLLTDSGELWFRSWLDPSSAMGFWTGPPGDPTLRILEGDPAPDGPPGAVVDGLRITNVSLSGTTTIQGGIQGDTVGPENDSVLWVGERDEPLRQLLREGDPAPGLPRGLALDLDRTVSASVRPSEILVLSTALQTDPECAGADTTLSDDDDEIIYLVALDGTAQLVVREGDALEVSPGDVRTVERAYVWDMNESGQFLLEAQFTDQSVAFFLGEGADTASGSVPALPPVAALAVASVLGALGIRRLRRAG